MFIMVCVVIAALNHAMPRQVTNALWDLGSCGVAKSFLITIASFNFFTLVICLWLMMMIQKEYFADFKSNNIVIIALCFLAFLFSCLLFVPNVDTCLADVIDNAYSIQNWSWYNDDLANLPTYSCSTQGPNFLKIQYSRTECAETCLWYLDSWRTVIVIVECVLAGLLAICCSTIIIRMPELPPFLQIDSPQANYGTINTDEAQGDNTSSPSLDKPS